MRHDKARGRVARESLMDIVRVCASNHLPIPDHATLGRYIGVDRSQVTRHLGRLMDDGLFTTRQSGRTIYVGNVL